MTFSEIQLRFSEIELRFLKYISDLGIYCQESIISIKLSLIIGIPTDIDQDNIAQTKYVLVHMPHKIYPNQWEFGEACM